jgi:hypothetical protein
MNGSLWCSFPEFTYDEKLTPVIDPATVTAYDDTVYVAFCYSDGDAWHYGTRDLVSHLNNPLIMDTDIPMGWTIPSSFQKFNPLLLEYFYGKRRPGLDDFINGSTGVSYTYPSRMTDDVYEVFLDYTKEVFQKLGISTNNYWDITPGNTNSMVGADEAKLKRYIEVVEPDAVFRGQSSHTGDYKIIDGVVCIEKVGNFNGSGCQMSSDIVQAIDRMVIRQKTGGDGQTAIRPNGPVFILCDINAWGDPGENINMVPFAVKALKERIGGKYEFVTPMGLVAAITAYESGKSLNVPNPKFA